MSTEAKTAARIVLETEASKLGVEIKPFWADRHLKAAIAERLAPNTYHFAGKSEGYISAACDQELKKAAAQAEKDAAAAADADAAARDLALAAAAPGTYANGGAAPRADGAATGKVCSLADLKAGLAAADRVARSSAELRASPRMLRR